ncbi:EAL domain-containing protein [Peribacillus glennii]|uniref:EAL domain-containing protein n=1 Tax=Peribacillus glennii TaxID=2303991 RepID=A0A372LC35_9BACI|nr:EAL domain-containing protein [Peribacillus glennii]RFU63452.1 EAL domain-containing protein [Peribacillus glennii]
MDAMEILTEVERIQPFYQPIFSADEHRVIGYEILGRFSRGKEHISLGPFFQDPSIPEEYRIDVDNYVLESALRKILANEENFLIFINRDPNLLLFDHGENFLDILKKYLQPDQMQRVVLEISDTDYSHNLEPLQHLLTYYKTYGIKIALDHLGEESHLNRIAQISPHILKVNLDKLRKTGVDSYQVILFSLSMLARKIGANLLFEHIEQEHQLMFAWKNCARYYQGFYLAHPSANLIDKNLLMEKFRSECESFIGYEKKKLNAIYQKTLDFNQEIQSLITKHKKLDNYEKLLMALAQSLESMCFRFYVCDEKGFQKSPNILLHKSGSWIIQKEYLNKNWSWRPYFLENIIKMTYEKRGILSDLYSDIETGEMIRTFSYPLTNDDFLFMDLSYAYLYENEALL